MGVGPHPGRDRRADPPRRVLPMMTCRRGFMSARSSWRPVPLLERGRPLWSRPWSGSRASTPARATGGQLASPTEREVSKASARVAAYGEVDELNAVIGLARAHLAGDGRLWTPCSAASRTSCSISAPIWRRPDAAEPTGRRCGSSNSQVERLEREIDAINARSRAARLLRPARRHAGVGLAASGAHRLPPRRARRRRLRRRARTPAPHGAGPSLPQPALRPAVRRRALRQRQRASGDVLWVPAATR